MKAGSQQMDGGPVPRRNRDGVRCVEGAFAPAVLLVGIAACSFHYSLQLSEVGPCGGGGECTCLGSWQLAVQLAANSRIGY
jgi:hypothetical protein